MAQIPTIGQWQDAQPHLANLRATVDRDLRPLLAVQGGAPFSVCREVLAYFDHLGHLFTGSPQVGGRFRTFMETILGDLIDPHYRERAGEVYQMYRCGTVHEFEPKLLENRNGQLLAWACYSGQRTDAITFAGIPMPNPINVIHLVPVQNPVGRIGQDFLLPISTNCLIDDLIESIDRFSSTGPDNARVTAWNRAARELNGPYPFDFTV